MIIYCNLTDRFPFIGKPCYVPAGRIDEMGIVVVNQSLNPKVLYRKNPTTKEMEIITAAELDAA